MSVSYRGGMTLTPVLPKKKKKEFKASLDYISKPCVRKR
jgi:hypothetical protein